MVPLPYHEEAPVLASPAEVPDRLRPLLGVAVEEDAEIDDGDGVPAACSGTVTVISVLTVRGMAISGWRHAHDRAVAERGESSRGRSP